MALSDSGEKMNNTARLIFRFVSVGFAFPLMLIPLHMFGGLWYWSLVMCALGLLAYPFNFLLEAFPYIWAFEMVLNGELPNGAATLYSLLFVLWVTKSVVDIVLFVRMIYFLYKRTPEEKAARAARKRRTFKEWREDHTPFGIWVSFHQTSIFWISLLIFIIILVIVSVNFLK